jgi:tRNA pseudouridine55 synthase
MPTRQVTVSSLEVIDYAYPNLKIRCDVSSGTYIRTLAADIGEVLGTGAYTTQLRRTRVGVWQVQDAVSLEAEDFAAALWQL